VVAAGLSVAPAATAKIWFSDMSGDTLRWNQPVTTTILNCPDNGSCAKVVRGRYVFLRPGPARRTGRASSIFTVGRIDGNGRLSFRVPPVPGGEYHLVASEPGNAKRWLPVSGTFRVRAFSGDAVLGCHNRSSARFPRAFTNPSNVAVGPLVLIGAAYTDPATIRRLDGAKFPLLVKTGHTVRIEIPAAERASSRLAYGSYHGDGSWPLKDGYTQVTFTACPVGSHDSSTGAGPATFWSGFVMTNAPRCLPLRVRVDGEPAVRRVVLHLGVRRCA
jgi:hypothetical protein